MLSLFCLPGEKALPQTHLYVEYVNGLYNVLKRIRKKYPEIPMMLCQEEEAEETINT
jgi:hypothetical protein